LLALAQLLDRDWLHIVLREVDADEARKGEAARNPLLATNSVEFALEGVDRVLLARKAPALDPL
jgi:hypothetical protein